MMRWLCGALAAVVLVPVGARAAGRGGLDLSGGDDKVWGSGVGKAPARAGKTRPGDVAFSDAAVAEAIRNGVAYLKSMQQDDGSWGPYSNYPVGPTAMAAYALMESELVRYDNPRMRKTLDWLKERQPPRIVAMPGGKSPYCTKTYELGLRANAWLAAMKQGAAEYREQLRKDATQLILSTRQGAYNYDSLANGQSDGDNSNSQYGVLGVWAAALADEEVPKRYWMMVMKHWDACQRPDGGWTYSGNGASTATMTAAGLASLFVCYDNLLTDQFARCNQATAAAAVFRGVNKALTWMDEYYQNPKGKQRGIGDEYYLLYGVERVGLATGYKYFGKTDWYKVGASQLLGKQNADGSWSGGGHGGAVVQTSYALLFLIRGRHAVLMNKLQYEGDWNNRPRDLAALTRWTSGKFETTVNWQIINLKVPPEEWHDAPILYIAGSTDPNFSDGDLQALRTFTLQGGTIFSVTECDGRAFAGGMRKVYEKLFPPYKLLEAPRDHPLYSINFKKLDDYLKFFVLSNGVRPLAVHVDKDLSRPWQLRQEKTEGHAFEAAANLALYLTDRALAAKTLVARGARSWPGEAPFEPLRTVTVARVKYRGNWDPEPLALERFARLMGSRTKTKVTVLPPQPAANLPGSGAQVAFLTGTENFALPAEDKAALKAYLAAGGLLVCDAAGGSAGFSEAARTLAEELGGRRPRRLVLSAPLFQLKGFEIPEVRYRDWSRFRLGIDEHTPRLKGALDADSRPQIIVSDEDLTAGMLGVDCYGLHGYQPQSAWLLARNIVLSRAKVLPPSATKPTQPAAKQGDKPKPGPRKGAKK